MTSFTDLLTFTRASTATRFNNLGVMEVVPMDQPRFDYNPATREFRGLLVEEQRTNLAAVSNGSGLLSPTRASWADTGQKFIDGTTPMFILQEDSTAASSHFGVPGIRALAANTTYAMYYIVKAAGRTKLALNVQNTGLWSPTNPMATFDLSAGTLTQSNGAQAFMRSMGGGFWMVGFVATMGASAGSSNIYPVLLDASGSSLYSGDGVSGVYIGGLQIEAGNFPTSYIPTTGTQATRAADALSANSLSPWLSANTGTIFAEWVAAAAPATNAPVWVLQGSGTNLIRQRADASGPIFDVYVEGVGQASIAAGSAIVGGGIRKTAAAWAQNSFQLAANGTLGTPDNSGGLPAVAQLAFAKANASPAMFNGWLRRLRYYPRRFSDAELQALTL